MLVVLWAVTAVPVVGSQPEPRSAEQQQRLSHSHLPAGIASLVVPPDGKSAVVLSGIFGPASLGAASHHR